LLKKILTISLVLVILAVLGNLVYILISHTTNDKFTDFYILGSNGQASQYPSTFFTTNGKVTSIQYDGTNGPITEDQQGLVILGITNHERQSTSYVMAIQIDGNPVKIGFQQNTLDKLGPIILQPDENWEGKVTFNPEHKGDQQKVEFLLYKNGKTESAQTLHLWIDVK